MWLANKFLLALENLNAEYFLGNEESLDLGACLTWQHLGNTSSGVFQNAFLPGIPGVVGFFFL